MEAVIFIGVQGTGKSTFYKERFFNTHVRVSRDLLRTQHREATFLRACLETGQRFVVDKTNVLRDQRMVYIEAARRSNFRVVGYYFRSNTEDALRHNAARSSFERVPDKAVLGTYKQLQLPSPEEGFDELFYVHVEDGHFVVEEWKE